MNKQLKVAACVGFLTVSFFAGEALAEVSANASIASNFVFRGVSYSADHAALQGGVDWSHESGVYAEAWLSTVDRDKTNNKTGTEYDLIAGFSNEVGAFGYDIAYITYNYTNDVYKNANDIKFGASYGPATVNYFIGDNGEPANNKYNYVELNLGFDLGHEFGLEAHYGAMSGDAAKEMWVISGKGEKSQVADYAVALTKEFEGFKFSLNHAKAETEDAKNFALLTKEFHF